MSKYKTTWTEIRNHLHEIQLAYVVRYLDPKNGKRFAIPYKTEPDAKKKRDQLKGDGARQLSITKDYLKGKFKEEVDLQELIRTGGGAVRYDNKKVGWFDKSGKRVYLGKADTQKLMSKDLERKKQTGDWITPYDLSKEDVSKDSAYAIGMAKAKDMKNDEPPVEKSTITKAHDIAKAILRKEEVISEELLIEWDKQELQEFSRSQLDALARQYSDLKGKTISIDNANKLRKIFDKIPNHFLNDLRKKHIPFLSGLALSRMVQKGIPVREDTDYLKSKLTTFQINNIKNTWKMKKASDVTPAVKDMIKKMDIPTQIAIKQANIPHLSKLVEEIEEASNTTYKVKKDGKVVFTGKYNDVLLYRKKHGGEIVTEDASDMAQAKATGTQKKIADLTTRIKDTEVRGRDIPLVDKPKIAINKADVNHMKLKLADLKNKLRSDRQQRAMAAQNEPETDSSGKPNKKKEITENE